MPLPDTGRVIFKRNPLIEVVCQLRFPPILRIEAEVPADFQECIRKEFPNYSKSPSIKVEGPSNLPEDVPSDLIRQFDAIKLSAQSSAYRNHEFSSEDGSWKLTLARTFIALTTTKYERWERFSEKLERPLEALLKIYEPAYFTRVGLRYIDIICRSELNLKDVAWSELLRPFILGLISTTELGDSIRDYQGSYEINLDDQESVVRLVTKLVNKADNGEECFVIDSDLFVMKKIELRDAVERLRFFNIRASRLIQWCMTERLFKALEPQKL